MLYAFYCKLITLKQNCLKYKRALDKYNVEKSSFATLHKKWKEPVARHQLELNGIDITKVKPPSVPSVPSEYETKRALGAISRVITVVLFIDYMVLFDATYTKTWSTNWFKALSLRQITKIETTLSRWSGQSVSHPVSSRSTC